MDTLPSKLYSAPDALPDEAWAAVVLHGELFVDSERGMEYLVNGSFRCRTCVILGQIVMRYSYLFDPEVTRSLYALSEAVSICDPAKHPLRHFVKEYAAQNTSIDCFSWVTARFMQWAGMLAERWPLLAILIVLCLKWLMALWATNWACARPRDVLFRYIELVQQSSIFQSLKQQFPSTLAMQTIRAGGESVKVGNSLVDLLLPSPIVMERTNKSLDGWIWIPEVTLEEAVKLLRDNEERMGEA